jgi:VIT1/CCC1 family predicted Fe2+/Mn2+ transporter
MDKAERSFLLKIVQPALAGLMDGSVSTLAPIFAAVFATHDSHIVFIIGLSTAVGAGISMALAEALSDTGELTGRGHPLVRGAINGGATFVGGIFHTIPFLIPDLTTALHIAYLIVGIELMVIAYIRYHYFNMRFWLSVLQVILGGGLVIVAGLFIGQA